MRCSLRRVVTLLLAFGFPACAPAAGDDDSATSDLREDTSRAPQIVRVPVRFTQNDVSDVGYSFSSSWVPFTDVRRDKLDGYTWGFAFPGSVEKIASWARPDMPGAGYATAWYRVEIPYDSAGHLAYGLTRVKLEKEFLSTEVAAAGGRKFSPLRVRAGSDQPCLSVTLAGALDGKLKAVPLPFTDEGFTERDWKIGDKDGDGVPIRQVVVGTLQFSAWCWPENIEGKTGVSGGVGVPGVPAFVMVDKSSGQGGSERGTVFVNLVENVKGKVSVGDVFSTNGGILGERDRKAFDDAVSAFGRRFADDASQGTRDALKYMAR